MASPQRAHHVVRMAAEHAAQGRTLHDALDALYRRHGLFESRQLSITLPGRDGLERMRVSMATLRAHPPRSIAGVSVVSVPDLDSGVHTRDWQYESVTSSAAAATCWCSS